MGDSTPKRRLLMVLLGIGGLVTCACGPTPYGSNVPTADPSAEAARIVLSQTPDSITLLPISPKGALPGHSYGFAMPHCGVRAPIDVDGSFWDAVGAPADPGVFDGAVGTFALVSADHAEFQTADGEVLELSRHNGAKTFSLCA